MITIRSSFIVFLSCLAVTVGTHHALKAGLSISKARTLLSDNVLSQTLGGTVCVCGDFKDCSPPRSCGPSGTFTISTNGTARCDKPHEGTAECTEASHTPCWTRTEYTLAGCTGSSTQTTGGGYYECSTTYS